MLARDSRVYFEVSNIISSIIHPVDAFSFTAKEDSGYDPYDDSWMEDTIVSQPFSVKHDIHVDFDSDTGFKVGNFVFCSFLSNSICRDYLLIGKLY